MRRLVSIAAAIAAAAAVLAATPDARAHSWYSGLKNEVGHGCCGGRDCAPIEEARVQAVPGGYRVQLPAGYRFDWPAIDAFVPNARAQPAKVGSDYHLCYWGNEVKCFFFPAPAF